MQIPSKWKDVLSKVQGVFPGAIIAGGALRDLQYGKPIKDVDIFCPVNYYDDSYEDVLYELFGNDITLMVASVYGREANLERNVHAVFELEIGDDKYDIILIDRVFNEIERFDLSICQIAHDGTTLMTTSAYEQTRVDKVIRVMNINRPDRQRNRIERMLAKFPDFTVDPPLEDEFDQLI